MVKKTKNSKNLSKREMIFAAVIAVLLLLLLWWWFAAKNNWWPMNFQRSQQLDSSEVEALEGANTEDSQPLSTPDTSANTSTNTSSNNGTNGANGRNGSNGTNGNNGGSNGGGAQTPATPSVDESFLRFSGGLGAGQSRVQVDAAASGLNQSCTVVANTNILGRQEVCIYRQGTRFITVTLLNSQVVSVARAGF